MREGEAEAVASVFAKLGVKVEIIDAQQEFLEALKGIADPEQKREAITQTFYKKVFGRIVRESGARFLLHGVAANKDCRVHNTAIASTPDEDCANLAAEVCTPLMSQ